MMLIGGLLAAMFALVGGVFWTSKPVATALASALDTGDLGGCVDIQGGGIMMGADPVFPNEGPPRKLLVSPFRLQAHEVTNSRFAAFIAETGHVTEAELNRGSALTCGRCPGGEC
ncbi:MAG: SUMF1/EgtB/PvdO family nonheme iron enzyme [Pseudomonadota bacterium]